MVQAQPRADLICVFATSTGTAAILAIRTTGNRTDSIRTATVRDVRVAGISDTATGSGRSADNCAWGVLRRR